MKRKTAKTTSRQTVRLTVDIPAEMDFRLYGLAKLLGMTKADLAARLLASGCERYQADRRLKAEAKELAAEHQNGAA